MDTCNSLLLAAAEPGNPIGSMLMVIVPMFIIMYLLIWKPQRKRQKEHDEMLAKTKAGDEIVTSGGIYGTVTGVRGDIFSVKIAEKVVIRVSRASIAINRTASKAAGGDDNDAEKLEKSES